MTSVVLCGLGLSKLSCLDQLPSLKWLSLSDNNLSSFEVCCEFLYCHVMHYVTVHVSRAWPCVLIWKS